MAMGKKWDIKEHSQLKDKTVIDIYDNERWTGAVTLSKSEVKELICDLLKCLKINIARLKG